MLKVNESTRNYNFDIIRIIAIMAVVMIHVADYMTYSSYMSFSLTKYDSNIGMIFEGTSHFAVPLFVMVSGGLFLDNNRHITFEEIFSKYIKNIFILFVEWSIIYAILFDMVIPCVLNKEISILFFLKDVFCGHYHMWYMLMIMGLYFITPYLRSFTTKTNKKMVLIYLIASGLLFFTAPILDCFEVLCNNSYLIDGINIIRVILEKAHLDFLGGYVAYFLAGWYIVKFSEGGKKRVIFLIGTISYVFMLILTFLSRSKSAFTALNILIFIISISIFYFIINLKLKLTPSWKKTIMKLSHCSFGVFMIHPMFLEVIVKVIPYKGIVAGKPILWIILIWLIVMGLSLGMVCIMDKIPLIKKLVRS